MNHLLRHLFPSRVTVSALAVNYPPMADTDCPSRIAASLQNLPLPRWGYVIYRCTYENDSHWNSFLDTLNDCIRDTLELYGQEQMMESLHWQIFDDRPSFEGMSKDAIRDHFDAWVRGGADQPPGDNPFQRTYTASLPRYCYCLQLDAVSLDAIANKNYEKPRDNVSGIGFVNLIKRNWQDDPDRRPLAPPATYYPEDEEDHDDDDEEFPEIEGSEEYDIGWMKVFLFDLAPYLYSSLIGSSDWDAFYARPPNFPRT